jgi:hypothetical protein
MTTRGLATAFLLLILPACGADQVIGAKTGGSDETDRRLTDQRFARVAMRLLADPAAAEIRFYRAEGRFSTDAEEVGLIPGSLVPGPAPPGGDEVGVVICDGARVAVLDETTPHGAVFAVKLLGGDGSVTVAHYAGEIPPCDPAPGPDAWAEGCVVTADGLRCPEEDG